MNKAKIIAKGITKELNLYCNIYTEDCKIYETTIELKDIISAYTELMQDEKINITAYRI